MNKLIFGFSALLLTSTLYAQESITLRFLETSDIHGCYLPYDFTRQRPVKASLASVSTYVKQLRKAEGDRVILMDNGDFLQGQPIAYYYNFIDTVSPHVGAQVLNYLKYDMGNMGNHDVETGHHVYDRWIAECNFPILGGNIIDKTPHNGQLLPSYRKALIGLGGSLEARVKADYRKSDTYLPPFRILRRENLTIAVIGMITPAIPSWLPENLWKGLYFESMQKAARKQMDLIKRNYRPDLIIGLFHSGPEGNKLDNQIENESRLVAENVPGFDIIFMGHDHRTRCEKVANVAGDSVLLINPANASRYLADVSVRITKVKGKVTQKDISGKLIDLTKVAPDPDYIRRFHKQMETVKAFVSRPIGNIDRTIYASDAFFGSSEFVDLIHQLQLKITKAQISFCAPLSSNAVIRKGEIYVSDMFNLYKYENMLYTMRLTGKEIKNYLEMSYGIWTQQMKSPDDHLILLNDKDEGFGRIKNPTFNFDSAAGIIYTVDVTQPEGHKINILRMADGQPFDENASYTVAVNSYRGNGGGDLLTKGAGIPKNQLSERILSSTDKDLRFYLMKTIERQKNLSPQKLNHWKFIPEKWTDAAIARDRAFLFNHKE